MDMNIPQNSQDGKTLSQQKRPGLVTALAVLIALDALAEGCGGIVDSFKPGNSLVAGVAAPLMPVFIAVISAIRS